MANTFIVSGDELLANANPSSSINKLIISGEELFGESKINNSYKSLLLLPNHPSLLSYYQMRNFLESPKVALLMNHFASLQQRDLKMKPFVQKLSKKNKELEKHSKEVYLLLLQLLMKKDKFLLKNLQHKT